MGKIYSYADLKGKVKVGWVVRAVPGRPNHCSELEDNGPNTQPITKVDDINFWINGCWHFYDHNYYLEVVSTGEKTWDNLEHGDVIVSPNNEERTIIDVLPHSLLLSSLINTKIPAVWWGIKECQSGGWQIKQTTPPEDDITEVTVAEVAAKFGVPVDRLRIKEEA